MCRRFDHLVAMLLDPELDLLTMPQAGVVRVYG